MNQMKTLADLAEHSGMSKSFWYKQSASGRIFCSKIGKQIRFTDEQWDKTLALFAIGPKSVPTRDELAARRAAAVASTRRAAR